MQIDDSLYVPPPLPSDPGPKKVATMYSDDCAGDIDCASDIASNKTTDTESGIYNFVHITTAPCFACFLNEDEQIWEKRENQENLRRVLSHHLFHKRRNPTQPMQL